MTGAVRVACVVFDFDGVLVDTNATKRRAYFDVLTPHGIPAHAVEAALDAGDGDRYQLIARAVDAARLPLDIDELAERYNDICEAAASVGPEIEGASQVLASLSKLLPLYLWSATPETPLRRIVERRGWTRHFQRIYGGPASKTENLRLIVSEASVPPEDVLVVGDSPGDLAACRACGCRGMLFTTFESPEGCMTLRRLDALPAMVASAMSPLDGRS